MSARGAKKIVKLKMSLYTFFERPFGGPSCHRIKKSLE
jgi:hypothetical protein